MCLASMDPYEADAPPDVIQIAIDGALDQHGGMRKTLAGDIDPVTEDLLIGQTAELEQFQWFVRAHLENAGGQLASAGAETEEQAADQARDL